MSKSRRAIKSGVDSFFYSLFHLGRYRYLPLGIHCFSGRAWLFAFDRKTKRFCRFKGNDPGTFSKGSKVLIDLKLPDEVDLSRLENVRFFYDQDLHHITFGYLHEGKRYFVHGVSFDLNSWKMREPMQMASTISAVVPFYRYMGDYLAFFGKGIVGLSHSGDFVNWEILDDNLFSKREDDFFDSENVTVIAAKVVDEGILVIYDSSFINPDKTIRTRIGALVLAKNDPRHVLWRSDDALWEEDIKLSSRTALGACFAKNKIYVYFLDNAKRSLSVAEFLYPFSKLRENRFPGEKIALERFEGNPVIEPKGESDWESEAALNPAAFSDGKETHLLYRAIGKDGVSRFGHAVSSDGLSLQHRKDKPIFSLRKLRGGRDMGYDPVLYPSGGSWGGAEDPRIVNIDGRLYLTMSAFDGWDFIRMAVSSISEDDFKKGKLNWSEPLFLSPEGEIHKNWVLFPEKINGKFAILHSISPEISIDYVDNLESLHEGEKKIASRYSPFVRSNRRWEKRMRGVGPPPLKTKDGWILLYHAMDNNEPDKYKLGAMLLGLKNPRKILARSSGPILAPEMDYENEGKAGVIYACGATIRDGKIFVYYGGGDRVSCVATADLGEFLDKLKQNKIPVLSSKKVRIR